MDAADPESGGEGDDQGIGKHAGTHHGDSIGVPDEAGGDEEAGSEIEGHKRRVGVLKGGGHVRRKAEQASEDEEHGAAPQDIVAVEPGDEEGDVGPEFPAHDEGDGEAEEGLPGRVLGGLIACDGDDAYVEEVDEQLVARDLLRLLRAPEQPFVEVLSDNRFLIKSHGSP